MKYTIIELLLNDIAKRSTLTIENAESSDIGTYTCKAANFPSSDTSSGMLTVNGKDFHFKYLIYHFKTFIICLLRNNSISCSPKSQHGTP